MAKVLIIDDSPIKRGALASDFKLEGHEVFEYAHPTNVPEGEYDAILLDYSLGGGDYGTDYADELKRRFPNAKLFMCSDHPGVHTAAREKDIVVLNPQLVLGGNLVPAVFGSVS